MSGKPLAGVTKILGQWLASIDCLVLCLDQTVSKYESKSFTECTNLRTAQQENGSSACAASGDTNPSVLSYTWAASQVRVHAHPSSRAGFLKIAHIHTCTRT